MQSCTPCPLGHSCQSPDVPPQLCSAGTYSDGDSAICKACDAGFSCNGGIKSPCPQGTYSESAQCLECNPGFSCNGGKATPCPPGSYNAQYKQTNCTVCAPGSFTSTSGSTLCQLSPPGYYIPRQNSTAFLPSGPGNFTSVPGSTLPIPCPPGTYSSSNASLGCTNCTAGFFQPGSGQSQCSPCTAPPGFYCNPTGETLPCPPGSYCLGSTSPPLPCAAGSYSLASGASSNSTCTLCQPGQFSTQGSPACTNCPLGTSTTVPGSATCQDCAPGTSGTASPQTGLPICAPCAANTFSPTPRGTVCQRCKSFYTSLPGASSCYSLGYVCQASTQPPTPALPSYQRDCVNLTCPFYLTTTPDGCFGCPPGRYNQTNLGVPGAALVTGECTPCPPNSVCPGILPWPLLADTSLLTQGLNNPALVGGVWWGGPIQQKPLPPPSPSTLPATTTTTHTGGRVIPPPSNCIAASLYPPALVTLLPPPFSYFSLTTLAVVIIAACVTLLLFIAHSISTSLPTTAFAARFTSALMYVDNFGAAHKVNVGDAIKHVPTPLGGLCTLVSVFALLTCMVLLTLRYAYDNTTVTTTLNYVPRSRTPFTQDIPWAAPYSPPFPLPPSTVVQLRVFAPAEQGCNTTLNGIPPVSVGANGGVWDNSSSVADCGDGRTMLAFTCLGCGLDVGASLSFYLPHTCQSLYIEALGVDATGEVQVLTFPSKVLSPPPLPPPQPPATSQPPSTLLHTVDWVLLPMASLLNNTIQGYSTRGVRMVSGPASVTYTSPGDPLLPLFSAVTVTISLTLDTSYSATRVDPTQTLAQLLASLVGLLGILSGFRFMFQILESYLNGRVKRGHGRGSRRWDGKRRPQWVINHLPLPEAKNAPGVSGRGGGLLQSLGSTSTMMLTSPFASSPSKRGGLGGGKSSSSFISSLSSSSSHLPPRDPLPSPPLSPSFTPPPILLQTQPALLTAPIQMHMEDTVNTTTTTNNINNTNYDPPDESGYLGGDEEKEEEEKEEATDGTDTSLSLNLPALSPPGLKLTLPVVREEKEGEEEEEGGVEDEFSPPPSPLYAMPNIDIPKLRPTTIAPTATSPSTYTLGQPNYVRKKER